MKPVVTVIDYGVGNIFSVCRALEHCGADVRLSGVPEEILSAEMVILPGVGAFADGMAGLASRGLVAAVKEYAATNRPLLGICLGMQMLMDSSEEFGMQDGLGLIPGKVTAIPSTGGDGAPHKIPHIGWNELLVPEGADWKGTVLENTASGSSVYFVHSFAAVPECPEHRLAECDYNGRKICAAVRSGLVFGCQFHPEKSGEVGLSIVKSFLTLKV